MAGTQIVRRKLKGEIVGVNPYFGGDLSGECMGNFEENYLQECLDPHTALQVSTFSAYDLRHPS